jgi:hypothetical protein
MPERWTSSLSSVAREQMTEGLFDRALEGPRLPPPGPTAGRRTVVAIVALAIGLAAVVIAVKSIDSTGTVPTNQITDSQYGWSATIPDGWRATPYDVLSIPEVGATPIPTGSIGIAFATFDLEDAHPYDFLAGGSRAVPSDGAIIMVDGGIPNVEGRTSPAFPPELLSDSGSNDVHGGFVANGMYFEILGQLGDDVQPDVRAQVNEIVSSIQFPSPPDPAPGEAVEFAPGLVSLGPSDRYPLRSVTPVVVKGGSSMPGQTIVVVHAPDGFYVLRGGWDEPCRLRWDSHAELINGCPAHPGPWTKYGASGFRLILVDVNFDGRLITSPYSDIHAVPSSYWHTGRAQQPQG